MKRPQDHPPPTAKQRLELNSGFDTAPVSGFRTPFVTSGRWADVGRYSAAYGPEIDRKVPGEILSDTLLYDSFTKHHDPYPSWSFDTPIDRVEIEAIFMRLTAMFGFQIDSTRNMFDYFLKLLDSRASRMGPVQALRSLHADYIGGVNANFRKWYFAAGMDLADNASSSSTLPPTLAEAELLWAANMNSLSPADCAVQVSLYLLCWGEANNVRFMPECLCFIFKCCHDHYYSQPEAPAEVAGASTSFLDHVITPLYRFLRDQAYVLSDDVYVHNDKDHKDIIGYDDANQLFWHARGLKRIVLHDKTKLMDIPAGERYRYLNSVNWNKVFYKTFREKRYWLHILMNFNRMWVLHLSVFWYYVSFNSPTLYTANYQISNNTQPTAQARLTIMALAGSIASFIAVATLVLEAMLVPRKFPGASPVFKRLVLLVMLLVVNTAPTAFLLWLYPLASTNRVGLATAILQFIVSIFSVLYLSIVPLGEYFKNHTASNDRTHLPERKFATSFFALKGSDKIASYGLWLAVFASKFVESYFFLILSLRDPVRELSIMSVARCVGEQWIGKWLCRHEPQILLGLIMVTDLILFFLDTYLWYIIWNTIFSVCLSFYLGVSIWTPWRNIFLQLPKRISSKIICSSSSKNVSSKKLVSQVWNSIIITMYREHLLSLEHVHKLIYKQITTPGVEGGSVLKEPTFFVSQEDQLMKSTLLYRLSEAQRRITFFAQSLSTPMPEVTNIDSMPSFTVLIPHYSEKITLSLREIIKEEDQYAHMTMLEYLKQLHPIEWTNFVKDTKMLSEEFDNESSLELDKKDKFDDLPFYSVGFKVATPEYILRTRVWASLRSQTLYRTVSGFMNYSRAIKLLFDVENCESTQYDDEYDKLEAASVMALRKFRIITSMQRLKYFSEEEKENKEFLLRAYPELQIAYLEEEVDPESGEILYYSCLVDGSCAILENGDRQPKYKIRLSGNPILGDGKSDNQNHSVVFARGEYIQLVDANQDSYLEECLKIRSVLAEFEEMTVPLDPYSPELQQDDCAYPVAIIGTREYIFSENIGILGDVAAGKEQTFGTLFARTLAQIGGKLHYGHPDFLNSIFMTTRGGVSKAQKGLHLNEDIYAGMNAIMRGGRIKHCEYMQCGKGRDLGFGSILNFTTKIGAGMGEQMLSREYFYLGTQLPLDRFLSFYYAHPGFHLNNVFIIVSINLFLIVSVNLAVLTKDSVICEYDRHRPITDARRPTGCFNLVPVVRWLERCIYSIFIVFAISFIPLWVQELTERGLYNALTRLGKHLVSFSPLFEVFLCRIYGQSLVSDIAIGGARYIATGRGFATTRVPLTTLYSRFAYESLYFAINCGFLILVSSITMWKLALVYLWVTILGLLVSPFLFNPNQFSHVEFFLDYKNYVHWMFRGNSRSRPVSWIGYIRLIRSRITGVKSKNSSDKEQEIKLVNDIKPSRFNYITSKLFIQLWEILAVGCAYLYSNSQSDSRRGSGLPANSLLRVLVVALGPIALNMVILLVFFMVSCVSGPLMTLIFKKYPAFLAAVVHMVAVCGHVAAFEFLWLCQNWELGKTILGFAVACLLQDWLFELLIASFISKEYKHGKTNRAWWSGKWIESGLKWHIISQPLREYLCKITELSYFSRDLFIGHLIIFIQIPILFIPYASSFQSMMLFWLKPGYQIRPRLLSKKGRRRRQAVINLYALVMFFALVMFVSIFAAPMIAVHVLKIDLREYVPEIAQQLIQPVTVVSLRKGHTGLEF